MSTSCSNMPGARRLEFFALHLHCALAKHDLTACAQTLPYLSRFGRDTCTELSQHLMAGYN
ncbi:hypothetical protein E3O11_09535 [Cryobacterium levicorallinum]|uniref:Uncharacterized protein n=1 Tax=Cryobacterium levicorallinum TaxID=995038 RepID=A0A4R8VL91_9MICO|nr:hypothetical protein [Cryobacterium levicorallinum]TFB84510.1 hypothetical protein E3O11_09535 [Cryobacterium levicorallinum]